jgi:class 3 adenylate cyclase/tetratricopeptide (TPR) repeat protein
MRVRICPNCGQENADGFLFCGRCGTALAAEPAREERKVVTVLFTDLVGFTGRSEQLDPEDVRATLSPYYARLRSEIERHGGTVEKFIGDAVMAVFGAPVAHEDDPERAVRAALAIHDAVDDLDMRTAVNTGEALVSLGARPVEGEGMVSGDVVNTAARMQSAAPVNGILVGDATYRATRHVIEYRDAEPMSAKGKSEPVPVWEAVAARSRFGEDLELRLRTALVGRRHELGVLVDALERTRRELAPQLVTLVGVPGIGKSRLVTELAQVVDRDPQLMWWRQGRSLPYGEGLSYWALGEIVKAQAGILETDEGDAAETKLRALLDDFVADAGERDWIEVHLRPLVGLSSGTDIGGDRKTEAHSAWRRLLEALAENRPLILVFEDMHWADDGLLDFVDYLADWAGGVPMLILGTARPELLDRRPGWGGGKRNASTLSIPPLSQEETAQLLASLLEQALLPAEIQASVLARAEGNPLYAEEYVRMLQDRGFLVRRGGGWRLEHEGELPLPESVQGMIAARLDALSRDEKELVQDAAVVGKVFWPDAVAAIRGRSKFALEEALHALERKEFVRRERRSAVAGETQYAFLHALVRDVSYGQIPRAQRVDKHRLAAEWIESLSSERSEDRAEMLAHHYREALALAQAAGVDASALRAPARAALIDASERARALNAAAAAIDFALAALDLMEADDPAGPRLQFTVAEARVALGETDFESALAARDGFLAYGDIESAALADVLVGRLYWLRSNQPDTLESYEHAAALVEDRPLSFAKARVFAQRARYASLSQDSEEAIELGQRALAMAEELGNAELTSHVLNSLGMAHAVLGDPVGLEELQRSVDLAGSANAPEAHHQALNNLANIQWRLGDLDGASESLARARAVNERYGYAGGLKWLEVEDMLDHELRGTWDEALARANAFLDEAAGTRHFLEGPVRAVRTVIFLGRGELEAAEGEVDILLEQSRDVQGEQIAPGLATAARVFVVLGRHSEADALLAELFRDHREGLGMHYVRDLPLMLAELGRSDQYLAAVPDAHPSPWLDAGVAVAEGRFADAAASYERFGARATEAWARLLAAEAFAAEGRLSEAEEQLAPALAFFRSARAVPYVQRGEALLGTSRQAASGGSGPSASIT